MQSLFAADVVSVFFLMILGIGSLTRKDRKTTSSKSLLLVCFSLIICCLLDVICYKIENRGFSDFFVLSIWAFNYAFGGFSLLFFVNYCYFFIKEKTPVNKWLFLIPEIVLLVISVFNVICIYSQKVVLIKNGAMEEFYGLPKISVFVQILVMLYLPVISFSKYKIIGKRSILILGSFGIIPVVTSIWAALFHKIDYTYPAGALAYAFVYILLENRLIAEKDAEQQRQLYEKNKNLEEYQLKLERAVEEQESHVKEITALNKSLEEYHQIIANAGLGIWYIFLKEGEKPRMNPNEKMRELLGIKKQLLTEEETYSWWFNRIDIGAIPSVLKSVDEMSIGKFSENTYVWNHPVQGNIYVRCGGTGRKLEDGTIVLSGYHSDVTSIVKEDEKHKEELGLAMQLAESANAAKTSFLFSMSHDIRTPMNAIIGFTNLLEKYQEDPERREDYLKKIQSSSAVLLSIINNVLEMSRIEKGTLEIAETGWSTEQLKDTIYSIFNEMMKLKNIEFTLDIKVQHHYVLCDVTKLREIFINIISNAYKYTENGGKVHFLLEELPYDKAGWGLYQTTITDTGIGMSEEFLPHIFEEFAREKNTTDIKIEGTGLGMSIVKRLVEFMNGKIEVKSKLGEGSTFTVTIPHRIADEFALMKYPDNSVNFEIFRGKRVLLVEDNELNAEIAKEILTEVGFEVDYAEDGEMSVQKIQDHDENYYDLILMDIQMPKMNGYEATGKIRALDNKAKAEVKILAMTANAFEEDKLNAKLVGMNGHIAKPIDIKELFRTLSGILENEDIN